MGRKVTAKLILLAFVLTILYNHQEIFAKEHTKNSKGAQEYYVLEYGEADGENGYYRTKPSVTIHHQGESKETVYAFGAADGTKKEGRLKAGDAKAVIPADWFAEGTNVLRVWTEQKVAVPAEKPEEPEEPEEPERPEKPEEPEQPTDTEGSANPAEESDGTGIPSEESKEPGKSGEGNESGEEKTESKSGKAEDESGNADEPSEPDKPEEPDIPEEPEPPAEYEIRKSHYKEISFKIDTKAPTVQASAPAGFDMWYQNYADISAWAGDTKDGSGLKSIECYVNGKQVSMLNKSEGSFRIDTPSADGNRTMVKLVATDKAGNSAVWEQGFYIDARKPRVEIKGASDYMITGKDVTLEYAASDENAIQTASVKTIWETPKGKRTELKPEKIKTEDGVYTARQKLFQDGIYHVKVEAKDRAGFTASQELQIIIDKNNPVISKVDELDGTYRQEFCMEGSISEVIEDFTSYTYAVTLDGLPYTPGERVTKEGRHQLKIMAKDAAGNESEARAGFVIDRTAPQINFGDTKNGKAYEGKKQCRITLEEEGDWIEEVKINGEKQKISGRNGTYYGEFSKASTYKMEIKAMDRAGNVTVETCLFEVVPKETILDKMLSPVKKVLGLGEKTFAKADTDERSGQRPGKQYSGLKILGVLLALSTLGGAVYIKSRGKS